MLTILRAMALGAVAVAAAHAQVPANAVTDSASRVAVPSSLEAAARRVLRQQAPAQGPTRLAPDISAVGDFIADLSPKGSTQETACRLCVREVELAIQAPVDPYFRGDLFLGFSDAEGVHIEQAFLTTTALPWALEARLGRFLMPFGKQNTTHRHDLHTIDYPYVLQRFLGEEGAKGTGIYLSRVFSPLGFYQELIVTAIDRIGEASEDLDTGEPINKDFSRMGYSARLRNYWDIGEATNIEISGSVMTGAREQPLSTGDPNAIAARQSHAGGDVTFRWRPLQQGNYKSFIAQAEFVRQFNEHVELGTYQGPDRDFSGFYAFARYQLTRRGFLGARFDNLDDPELGGETLRAASGYLLWYPSEFSKVNLAFERVEQYALAGSTGLNRILLQATFSVGPHKPHPF